MPTAERDGVSLYYETVGDGETVAFVTDVGYGAWLWGWLHDAVAGPREALAWDPRGTGRSDCPDGPYTVATLADDLEAVLAASDARRVHLVGAGLGGMAALSYARRHDRARSLTLLGTAARGDAVDDASLDSLFAPLDDPDALRSSLTAAMATPLDAMPDVVDDIVRWRQRDDADRAGWTAQAAACRAFDASGWLYEITCPALVLHGTDDAVVPTTAGRDLAAALPRGRFRAVDGGHLCFLDQPRAVADTVVGFLEDAGAATGRDR